MIPEPTMNNVDAVLQEIEKTAQERFLPIIGPQKGKLLAEAVRKTNPFHVLEVGTLIGYSAILMGKEMQPGSEIVTIEIHPEDAELARQNIQKAHIPPQIKVIVGNALDVIPTLRGPFDLVFIDAEKTGYLQYLKLAEQKLHEGTVVFADNAGIFADLMADYISYVSNNEKYHSSYIRVEEDGVEISVKL